MPSDLIVVDVSEKRSSLVRKVEYDEHSKILAVFVRYAEHPYIYEEVEKNHFLEFTKVGSIGKYFLNFIKPNFKLKKQNFMADVKKRPPTKNLASDQKRFIKMSLNVREIYKQWIQSGEKGDYLGITLHLLPDGTVDQYGQLGMVTQDVPTSVYKAAEEEKKGNGKLLQGPILGNGIEFDWNRNTEGQPGTETGAFLTEEAMNDLPF